MSTKPEPKIDAMLPASRGLFKPAGKSSQQSSMLVHKHCLVSLNTCAAISLELIRRAGAMYHGMQMGEYTLWDQV